MRTTLCLPLLLLALLGCRVEIPDQQKSPAGESTEDPVDEPSPYDWEPEDGATASFDVDMVELALDDFITRALSLNAVPVLGAYEQVLAAADDYCPAWDDYEGNVFWYANCTTGSGTRFDGYGFTTLYEDSDVFGDGGIWDVVAISGSATVRDAEGHTFHLGGGLYEGTGTHPDYEGSRLWVSSVAGGFLWDGPGSEGTWLEDGATPSLLLYAQEYPSFGNGHYMYLDGSVGAVSDAATAIQVSTLIVADRSLGMPCREEPFGTISVRDADGHWWDIRFDYDEDVNLTGDCDGCGGAWAGDEYLGEVCADFSPLLDWENQPW